MVFEIADDTSDPRKLTQSVLQVIALLDMYQAELARVLHMKCGDIGELASARRCLETDTGHWQQALLFVRFYRLLFNRMNGDGVAMRHWLRVENAGLGGVPHRMIVDDDRLAEVVRFLEISG
ncbi:MAG: hypothetical protein WBP44_05780 [Gammaproteobacteria bacterium]